MSTNTATEVDTATLYYAIRLSYRFERLLSLATWSISECHKVGGLEQ